MKEFKANFSYDVYIVLGAGISFFIVHFIHNGSFNIRIGLFVTLLGVIYLSYSFFGGRVLSVKINDSKEVIDIETKSIFKKIHTQISFNDLQVAVESKAGSKGHKFKELCIWSDQSPEKIKIRGDQRGWSRETLDLLISELYSTKSEV
tara:strand:+ start:242 stop:685 length:444 start_codon:yes stop_codon:yes gene_type:complete